MGLDVLVNFYVIQLKDLKQMTETIRSHESKINGLCTESHCVKDLIDMATAKAKAHSVKKKTLTKMSMRRLVGPREVRFKCCN